MAKILGLDLGTNSIGWAVVDDEQKQILGIGSRIFPEGVEKLGDGENEISKNASRTAARGTRRQFFRRRLRKKILLQELSKHEMCPLTENDFLKWKSEKKFPEEKLKLWFKKNPYELRNKAVNEEISLEDLGRIFYHLLQRRGFQSNSRSVGEDEGAIYDGKPKEGKIGITETKEKIGEKTLGQYLNSIAPKEFEPYKDGLERIRNRYTTRQMYIDEFEKIWEKQKTFHSELTLDLKEKIGGRKKEGYKEDGILFHQRPLRSQKHLVGNCSFEPSKTKCPQSAIPFEMFRCYQFVNTIECNGKLIDQKDREKIVNVLLAKDKSTFKDLRKAINKLDTSCKFNYKDDDKVVGTYTISNLSNKKFFGEKWFEFTEKEQEDIWHVLYFFEDRKKLKEYAMLKWNFDEEKATKISKFNLKDKYSNLSRKAINNILPFLKMGFMYDTAVVLGGVKNAFGEDWKKLNDAQIDFIISNVPEISKTKVKGGFIELLKEMLKTEFNLSEKQLSKLYHHSASINATEILEKLPVNKEADKEIQSIRNPIVITALFELRKLVNEIIDVHGKPEIINIELARDLKISKTNRNDIRKEQKRLERENDRIKEELILLNQRITHDNLLLYKLWEECNHTCPYTGNQISVNQLFTGEVQIEHIIPWSRSLNDSFLNKTLCFADENRAKGDQTPYEYYSKQGEAKWNEVKDRALSLFHDTKEFPNRYKKFKQFITTKFDPDFISRQLNDTRYISREAKSYLEKICNHINVSPGQMTSNLRQKWGLNEILNKEENEKTREDHRHHAVDALVMACSKVSYLQELSKWNRYHRSYDLKEFPMPWEGFRQQAEQKIENILVSHKKINKVLTSRMHTCEKNGKRHTNQGIAARGQLHKEFVYGKRKAPHSKEAYHIRKPLTSFIKTKQLEKIVDINIKELVLKRVAVKIAELEQEIQNCTDNVRSKQIAKELEAFKKDGTLPNNTFTIIDKNGIPQASVFLPNKNGEAVPIRKVRIKENIGGAEQLKENINQHVNPRNNHHVLIYKDLNGNLKEEIITFWTAVERKKQKMEVFQLPFDGKEIVTTLQINDMFLLGLKDEEIDWENPNYELLSEHLFRVQKFTSGDYYFRYHKASSILNLNEKQQINSFGEGKNGWLTHNPIKVKISSTGIITKV